MRELGKIFFFASTLAVQECEFGEMHSANLQDDSNFTK